ncbi:MAG: hypothetical protein IPL59_05245 [Candidatus Competibacteraceae bacterium]|nr:hypothetical protein [Candidatus Competibacteraceae bacterium]
MEKGHSATAPSRVRQAQIATTPRAHGPPGHLPRGSFTPKTPPRETTLTRPRCFGSLASLLSLRQAVYCPGEVCRLLRISPTTLRRFGELAEHPAVIQR